MSSAHPPSAIKAFLTQPPQSAQASFRDRLTGSSTLVPWSVLPTMTDDKVENAMRNRAMLRALSAGLLPDLLLAPQPGRPTLVTDWAAGPADQGPLAGSPVCGPENPIRRERAAEHVDAEKRASIARPAPSPAAVATQPGEDPIRREKAAGPALQKTVSWPAHGSGRKAARGQAPAGHPRPVGEPNDKGVGGRAKSGHDTILNSHPQIRMPLESRPTTGVEDPTRREAGHGPATQASTASATTTEVEDPTRREAGHGPTTRASTASATTPREDPTRREPTGATARSGPLRNGNPRGNPNTAPRCGARTRLGCPCLGPAMKNGRCRMHGGASTGPRTAEGRARISAARVRQAYGSAEEHAFDQSIRALARSGQELLRLARRPDFHQLTPEDLMRLFMPIVPPDPSRTPLAPPDAANTPCTVRASTIGRCVTVAWRDDPPTRAAGLAASLPQS